MNVTTVEIAQKTNIRHADIMRITKRLFDKKCLSTNTQISNYMSRGRLYKMYICDEYDANIITEIILAQNKYKRLTTRYQNPVLDGIIECVEEDKELSLARCPIEELGNLNWWLNQLKVLNSKPEKHISRMTHKQAFKLRLKRMKESLHYKRKDI